MDDPTAGHGDVPFTLSCCDCDCESPASFDAAVAAGWILIQFDPDGLSENYVGLCPQCAVIWNAPPNPASRMPGEGGGNPAA